MKKRANISFAVFTALIVICCGAALVNLSISSKYNSKTEYQRLKNRYVAECGIDTSIGFFLNYLDNRELEISYTKNADNSYSVNDVFSPYILDEIRESDEEIVDILVVSNEVRNYLVSLGYLDFASEGQVRVSINTLALPEKFKISQMCTEPDFLIETEGDTEVKRSMLNPIYLTISSSYNKGNVMCNVKISNLYAVRNPYPSIEVGEVGSVEAYIDTQNAKIEIESYQNYGGAVI